MTIASCPVPSFGMASGYGTSARSDGEFSRGDAINASGQVAGASRN